MHQVDAHTTNPIEKYQFIHHFVPHPHRKSRARLLSHKAIFTYSVSLVLIFGLFRLIPVTFPGVLGYASNITITDLLKLTNQERDEAGLSELKLNPALSRAAELKAKHMFENDYWAHIAPDGTDPWRWILSEGYDYVFAGENLAKNFSTSDEVVEAWYMSPTHKDNLLSDNYDEIGFAVVNGVLEGYETTLVVQMFGRPRDQTLIVTQDQEQSLLDQLEIEKVSTVPQKEMASVLPSVDVSVASRSITLAFGGFLVLLLLVDVWYSRKKSILKFTGHTIAHIIVLLVALIGVWYVLSPGVIL